MHTVLSRFTAEITYGGLYCLLLIAFDAGFGIGAWFQLLVLLPSFSH